ncbi:MAG: Asp23/Gls24 family envelope stress response protein [Acidimicrobiales bacterium]
MGNDAGTPAPSTVDVARAVAEAARTHDDVDDLDAGLAGEFATYGLGDRVPGVRVDRGRDGHVDARVRIVVRFGRPLPTIGDEVHTRITAALRDLVAEAAVHVHVADIVTSTPPELEPSEAP